MIMHWPQIVIAALLFIRCAIHADNNGKPLKGTYGGGSMILAAAIWFAVLYAGGFWTGGK